MTDSVGLLLDKLESKDKTIADQHRRLAVWDRALGQWESDRAALVARIAVLEKALDDMRCPKAAAWTYLDDGVTLLEAALQAIPERYRDGDPNQLHHAISEWLSRPARAALSQVKGAG